MKDICKYEFYPELNILFKTYFGMISINDISSSWETAIADKTVHNEMKGIIIDYRKGNFNISVWEHTEIANFYKAHLDVFGGLKIAIITTEAKDIVIPIMLKTKDDGYVSNVFSTVEAAVNWVLS